MKFEHRKEWAKTIISFLRERELSDKDASQAISRAHQIIRKEIKDKKK